MRTLPARRPAAPNAPAAAAGQAPHEGHAACDPPAAPLALSAAALGCALQVNFGQYHALAIAWLTLSLAMVALCIAKPTSPIAAAIDAKRTWALGFALATQFVLLLTRSPGATGALAAERGFIGFRAGALVAAGLVVAAMWVGDRWRTAVVAGILLVHALMGLWMLRAAPDPGIDVGLFQRDAAAALVRGENPYRITFVDPYADSARLYGPGLSVNGRLQFGYPYPPLSLMLVTPAYLLGDFRYSQLAAMTLSGALVAFMRRGRTSIAAAALLLFTPRGFFVLEAGWTEPLVVLLLASTVWTSCRLRRSPGTALGLLVASKQYAVLALLATPLLPAGKHRTLRRVLAMATGVAAVVTLPLALWDLPAFLRSALWLQVRQPFRDDALSYLVPLKQWLGVQPPTSIAFILTGLAALALLRRPCRGPSAFAAGVAMILFVFFAFNKQAFCNYYYLVIGALCCAVGAAGPAGAAAPVPVASGASDGST